MNRQSGKDLKDNRESGFGRPNRIIAGDALFKNLLSMKLSQEAAQQAMQKSDMVSEAERHSCQSYVDRVKANIALMTHCDRMQEDAAALLSNSHFSGNKKKSVQLEGVYSANRKNAKAT